MCLTERELLLSGPRHRRIRQSLIHAGPIEKNTNVVETPCVVRLHLSSEVGSHLGDGGGKGEGMDKSEGEGEDGGEDDGMDKHGGTLARVVP